jgi:hypothetical protein
MFLPRWILWLEKKAPWLSVPHLGLFIVILQVAGYFFVRGRPDFADRLVLDPAAVLDGELWRLVTFIAIPLSDSFLMFFILWFLYYIFKTLRSEWGDFKFSLYFFLAWFGAVLGAFLFNARVENFVLIESTFFFAIATLLPDYEVMLFFILPLKMKWIALFTAILLFIQQILFGAWQMTLCLALSCINYIIFFGPTFYSSIRQEMKRRRGI